MIKLYHGDCLEIMPKLVKISVDCILCDPPYNKLKHLEWDKLPLNLNLLWESITQVIKPGANIILTSVQPFTSLLVMSKFDWFRYEIIWEKSQGTNPLVANKRPIPKHENILLFNEIGKSTYNPIMNRGMPYRGFYDEESTTGEALGKLKSIHKENYGTRYPTSIIKFSRDIGGKWDNIHCTQKPLSLMKWLISTYTNPHDIILDPTMGSGTTGAACIELGRNFIGIEKEEKFFKIAQKRLQEISSQIRMSDFV